MNNIELKESRKKLKLTQTGLANLIGRTTMRTVQNWESGINKIPDYVADLITEKVKELNAPNFALNEFDKKEDAKVVYDKNKGRPFYNADWTLGFKDINDNTVYNPDFNIDFPPANRESVEWFSAKGSSMLGEINSGDYVALEEIKDFSWFPLGRIYGIVTKNGFRTIKRVVKSENNSNYCLVSSNPNKDEHPDQDIPKDIIIRLFKVVFVIKDLDE
jgi:transcriptional regulator with XRE-family HTH domain